MHFVNKIKQKFKNNRKIVLMTIIFFVSFLFCESALGFWMDDIYGYGLDFISWIIYGIVIVIGKLIGLFIGVFLVIIEYNTFINAEPVIIGWEIIRDICNMGFVIVLLIIAIASILQIQTYHYRTWLPKLVLMAILINFSKLICGILIDASQIITLTFASGIQSIGAGNFMDALGINHLLSMDFGKEIEKNKEIAKVSAINALGIMGTIFLTLIVALIALVVVFAITLIFIIRIVALWILIILSPFAYLFSASPLGHQYASQWWQKFSQWVITGPVMLFFIWLSLLTIKNLTSGMFSAMKGGAVPAVGLAEIGSPETMGAFILACCMLMASLIVAQQLGGYAAKIAGGAYSKITNTGDKIVSGSWKGIKTSADWVNRKSAANFKTPDLNIARRFNRIWKPALEESKEDDLRKIDDIASAKGMSEGAVGWFKGMAYGGSKDFVRDRWSMQGVGRSLRSTFRKSSAQFDAERRTEDEGIKDNEKRLARVMTKDEYDQREIYIKNQLNTKNRESQSLDREKDDLGKDITDLALAISALGRGVTLSGSLAGRTYDSLNDELKEKKEEKEKNKQRIEENKEVIKSMRSEKAEFLLSGREAKRNNTFFTGPDRDIKVTNKRKEIQEEIKESKEKSIAYREKADKYRLDDREARRARRIRRREAASDLSENSEDLMRGYGSAIANGKGDEATGILEKLMTNKDINEILKKNGYNEKIGLSPNDLEKINKRTDISEERKGEIIEDKKGFHDFIRDSLGDKLGMDKQRYLEAQSELGGIAKATMQTEFMEAVKIQDNKYVQNDEIDQQALAKAHMDKQDSEAMARKGGKFFFGGGSKKDGEQVMNSANLEWLMSNWAVMNKQFNTGRPNAEAVKSLYSNQNMRILNKAVLSLSGENRTGFEQLIKYLKEWGPRIARKDTTASKSIRGAQKIIDEA